MEKIKEITVDEAQSMFASSSSDGYTGLSYRNAKLIAAFLNNIIGTVNTLIEQTTKDERI